MTDEQLAELIVARAEQDERQRTRRPLPRWLGPTMRALPKLLALVTVMNGLIGVLAIVSPWLRMAFGEAATLAPAVAKFFDDVLVMAEDARLREARLRLMKRLETLILQLADVSEIVPEESK